jgi:hypothetical protein
VVNVLQSDRGGSIPGTHRLEARKECTPIVSPFDQAVDGVAIGVDGGDHHFALIIAKGGGLLYRLGPALDRDAECIPRVVHPECDIADPVPMQRYVRRRQVVRCERGRQHQANLVLLKQVAGAVPGAGLGAAIGHQLESERGPVVVARLLGVPHVELDEVGPVDGEGIGGGRCGLGGPGLHDAPSTGGEARYDPAQWRPGFRLTRI